jgi:hypothetical protein
MNEGLKRKARLVFLVILAVVGVWRLGVGSLSQLDDKLLWFDDEAALGAAKESLTEPMGRMYDLCTGVQGHENLVLDPKSADDLGVLCNRLHDARSGDSHQLLFYMSWHKLRFTSLVKKVTDQQTDVDLMGMGMQMRVLECSLLPHLEAIKSVDASSRVSEVLLGLALLVAGLLGYLRWRRGGVTAPEGGWPSD